MNQINTPVNAAPTKRIETRAKAVLCHIVMALVALCLSVALLPVKAFALEGPELTESQAAIVVDQAGNVLWSLNPDEELPMASITKIMTAMVALDSGVPLDTVCTITEEELYWNSQEAGYKETDTPTLLELFQAMLVYSGNDAALNVALNVSGTEEAFVNLMNQKAAELGMTHTHFANPHGLEDEGHYSCVSDLVLMGRYAMEHYPLIAETVQMRSVDVVVNGQVETLYSTDDLMEIYEGLLGIKTGAVEAGKGFLGASRRGDVALYTAVLGCVSSEGRFYDTALLMDWAYETFRTRSFGQPGAVLRVSPYALSFKTKCPITMPSTYAATVWPEGSVSYRRVTEAPDVLVEPGDVYAATWWRQSGRFCGGGSIKVDGQAYGIPSVNVFALPLFLGSEE